MSITGASPAGVVPAAPAGARPPAGRGRSRGGQDETRAAYAFLAPNFLLIGVFVLIPLVWAAIDQPAADQRVR